MSDAHVVVVSDVFERALSALSLDAIAGAADWWARVGGQGSAAGFARADAAYSLWNRGAVIGMTYYRLLRALETGYAPRTSIRGHVNVDVTVGDLVREFSDAAGVDLSLGVVEGVRVKLDPFGVSASSYRAWRDADVAAVGKILDDRVKAAESGGPGVSESVFAGTVQMLAADGVRTVVERASAVDGRCRGWIRVSATGRPCAFCAMLLGRGAVYKSRASATRSDRRYANGTTGYHPNCKCYSRPIFAASDLDAERFKLNREMRDAWYSKAHEGNTLKSWRKYYRRMFGR